MMLTFIKLRLYCIVEARDAAERRRVLEHPTTALRSNRSMKTNELPAQESAGTTEDRLTGPHPGEDKYGRIDHYYWRCERCGAESVDKNDLRWCC